MATILETIVRTKRGVRSPRKVLPGKTIAHKLLPPGYQIKATQQSDALSVVQLLDPDGQTVATLTGKPDNVKPIARRLIKVYFKC